MKDGYFTRSEVTRQVKEVVAKSHGLKPRQVKLTFRTPWVECHFPTGLVQKCAYVELSSPGFRPERKTLEQARHKRWSMY